MYEYGATLVRVIDGDTVELNIDLGFRLLYRAPVRLKNVNAPERTEPDGPAATEALQKELDGKTLRLVSHKLDKYGRVLGTIYADGFPVTTPYLRPA